MGRTGRIAGVVAAAALLAACSSAGGGSATPAASSASSTTSTAAGSPSAGTTSASASASAAASASSTSASPTVSPTTATPSPSPTVTLDPALVGTWHADAASILASSVGRGSLRSLTNCTGPVVLTFTAQGRVADQGRITCTGRGATGHGQFSSTGRYTADGTVLTVSRAVTRCTLSVAGVAIPCAFAYGNGTARYRVSGATLTLTFRTTTGTRTQTYSR